jgi:splicing factor 3B subunit 3
MHLYNVTLQKSSGITAALYGNFSAPRQQEVLLVRGGRVLELARADDNGKVQTVHASDVFGMIRSIATARLTGGNRDYIVLGTDSGKIVILEYSADKQRFERVHAETYGKTGVRRIVPGQYVATDPRGRAVMVGAIEKQKFVYILNRDSAARLTISSPLEAHKSSTLTFDLVGVDVGYDNPIFAALEVDMEEVDNEPDTKEVLYEKLLVFYELDLGLNHVVRKWSDPVDPTANKLIAVPGGTDGPGGVLVCSENFVVYKAPGQPERRCALPRRKDLPSEHGLLVVAAAVHKQRDLFFILVQSECGDLYKVTLQTEGESVSEVRVRYLDSVPTCTSLCILKSGFLFCASEFGNHGFYQFQGVGEDEDSPSCSSKQVEAGDLAIVELEPRPLQNLLHVDDIDSLCPIVDAKVVDPHKTGSPYIAALCGRGPRSSLRMLQHGLAVSEMAVSELPGNPNAVWTVRKAREDPYDAYIVVSFVNATLVLSIGETVEEVTDSGLKADSPTLFVALLGEDALVQVHPGGIRHVRGDGRVNEWTPPKGKPVVHACANQRQVVVSLSGGEVLYFELDAQQTLAEIDKKEMGHEVSCLELGSVPEGRTRSRFLAVGGWDNTIRILSLDPDDCMSVLAVLALPAQAESAALVSMPIGGATGAPALFLCIGLNNGVMLRARLEPKTGQLSDSRTRFLGAKAVKLFRLPLGGKEGVLALSSRPWAAYNHQFAFVNSPLAYQALEHGCSFASEHCPEGIVAIAGNTLRILSLDRLGDAFHAEALPLRYTPRKVGVHSISGNLVVIEADHNAYNEEEKAQLYAAAGVTPPLPAGTPVPDDEEGEGIVTEQNVGVPRAMAGKWASCIRVVDPATRETLSLIELDNNEAAVSVAMVPLRDRAGETFVFVGTVKDMSLKPRALSAAYIHCYQFTNGNTTLELVHKTPVEDVPKALVGFGGRLLAGVGSCVRLFDMGKKRLLRKCDLRGLPTLVHSIHVISPSRLVVGDLAESFHYVKYQKQENTFVLFADDAAPRWLTASCALDANTVAGADKFGNIFVTRLPQEVSDDVDDAQLLSSASANDALMLNGAPSKSEELVQYHVGETVTSLQKVNLGPGCAEVLLYTTIMGGVGALLPLTSKEDLELMQALEMHLRQEAPPLSGRDQLFFRSAYFPLKGVVDGDFCAGFNTLPLEEQRAIAEDLDRTPAEISKKLEELLNRVQ